MLDKRDLYGFCSVSFVTKIQKKECTIDQILDISAEYLGPDGLAQAKRECAADETCKSVMDVSIALGFDNPGNQFLLCKSGADEVLPSVSADIYVKGDFVLP